MKSIKIKNKHSNRRFVIITASSIVLAGLIAGGVYAYHVHTQSQQTTNQPSGNDNSGSDNINYDKPTDAQKQAGNDAKQNAINNTDTPSSSSITISSVNQADNTLHVRTTITTIDDTGTCNLVMSMAGSADITMVAGTQTLGSYSVCKGFDIPTTDLTKGTWQVKVTYSSQGQSSVATKQVRIE